MNDYLFTVRGQNIYRFDPVGGTFTLITAPNAVPMFKYGGSGVYSSAAKWRNQLIVANTGQVSPVAHERPKRIYEEVGGNPPVLKMHEVGLEFYDGSSQVFTPIAGTGGKSYSYAIHYQYEYTVGDISFISVSTVYQKAVTTATDINVGGDRVEISGFDSITALDGQYDINNITIEIYRTRDAGTTFYKVGDVANGTGGTFSDTVDDATLETNQTLYTTGGLVEHWPAPKCKYVTSVNDCIYYGNSLELKLDSTESHKPYRLYQSIPSTTGAIDPTYYLDLDDDIVGVSHISGTPIVFTDTFIYRVEGRLEADGTGDIRARVISETIGCASHTSIVKTSSGLYFAGRNGFYRTDGYNFTLLTPTLAETYKEFVSSRARREKIHASYDSTNERIYWSVADNDTENNIWFIYNIKKDGFTTGSGVSGFRSAQTIEVNDIIYRTDELGYVYAHAPEDISDLIRDENTAVASWSSVHIPFDYESVVVDGGNPSIKKWFAETTISVKSDTNLVYGLESINDDGRVRGDMKEVRRFGTFFWGDGNFVWGDPDIQWRIPETESKQRHYPRRSMRARRKQLRIKPDDAIIYKSDIYATGTASYVDPLKPSKFTVLLDDVAITWPTDIDLYKIKFDQDDYDAEFVIKSRTDTTLTIEGGGLVPAAGLKWHIVGKHKNQTMEIKAISMRFAAIDNIGDKHQSSEDGGNDGT
jgi:hypothetical protein